MQEFIQLTDQRIVLIAKPCMMQTRTTTTQQHRFHGPISRTTRMSWYQKGKTSLDLLEQETEWHWHQLGHMQICTSPQITTPAPTTQFFTDHFVLVGHEILIWSV